MRAFLAIPIPDPVRDALERVQEQLPFGRPADPEQLHLTLAFLGEQPDDLIQSAHEALEDLRFPAFVLQLQGLGTFGDRSPTALWAGVRDPAPAKALRDRILPALHGAGITLERTRFRPHVTLARLARTAPADHERLARFLSRWEAFPSPAFTVDSFALYRSTLRPSGAIHEELARYPLT
ncbi:RNA 2',3'-cyclic phosphodiesterase [Rubellimicrobium aerolatum]|uniref:RNA 2',3'-cyclic phosphodiesterase n=1 Tax=Rubellimicrobium aerolatum TaxID=490979 RepID=A0ABW0S931_9RHOB|nr:RNA 2',3'-cyclic phosphodiesterase [Rubellimicrobium aerolatum]MBP1804809.1 2'-5' RNA ligase [Rubellimicrobium aerolatum]